MHGHGNNHSTGPVGQDVGKYNIIQLNLVLLSITHLIMVTTRYFLKSVCTPLKGFDAPCQFHQGGSSWHRGQNDGSEAAGPKKH